MMDWNGHMSTGGWISSIFVIIVVLALVAAIAWTARDRRDPGAATAVSAREILDGRLASGEINVGEYEQLRQALGGRSEPTPEGPPVLPADTLR